MSAQAERDPATDPRVGDYVQIKAQYTDKPAPKPVRVVNVTNAYVTWTREGCNCRCEGVPGYLHPTQWKVWQARAMSLIDESQVVSE